MCRDVTLGFESRAIREIAAVRKVGLSTWRLRTAASKVGCYFALEVRYCCLKIRTVAWENFDGVKGTNASRIKVVRDRRSSSKEQLAKTTSCLIAVENILH